MKNLVVAIVCVLSINLTSCCKTTLVAGLVRENPGNCARDPSLCYDDISVCGAEDVYLCWLASDDVTSVNLGDLGVTDELQGCRLVEATTDKTILLKTKGGKCDKSYSVDINVINGNEDVLISATHNPNINQKFVWELNYPVGQVSPEIMANRIEPACLRGVNLNCYPDVPIDSYLFCGPSGNCNGQWTIQKYNLTNSFPATYNMVNTEIFLVNSQLVGKWQFTPPQILHGITQPTGQALFYISVACRNF